QFREKNGGTDSQRNSEEQGNAGGHHGSVDERQGAELIENGIPDRSAEEGEAELVPGKHRTLPELKDQEQGDEHYGGRKQESDYAGDLVAFSEAVQKRARARNRARVRNRSGSGCQLAQPGLLNLVDGLQLFVDHGLRKLGVRQSLRVVLSVLQRPLQESFDRVALARI